MQTIQLDTSANVLRHVLDYMYQGEAMFTSVDDVDNFLAAARSLGLDGLENPIPELLRLESQVPNPGVQAVAVDIGN